VTSLSSDTSNLETRILINYLCGPFNLDYRRTWFVKNQLIQFETLGEDAFGATALRPKFENLDRVSFDAIIYAIMLTITSTYNKGRLELSSARANSATGWFK